MTLLVRNEITRYRSRRLIGFLLLGCLLLSLLMALKSSVDTRPPSDSEMSTAVARAKIESARADIQSQLQSCLKDPSAFLGGESDAEDCRDSLLPAAKSFLPRPTLDLSGTLNGNGSGTAALVIALLVVAAASFAGSDWQTGSMTGQLVSQPRRARLFWAKALAVAAAAFVVTLAVLAVFWGILWLVSSARDLSVSGAVGGDLVQHTVRAAFLAAGASIGAFALTAAFRSTVGVLSLCFAFAMVGELLVALPFEGAARWSLGNNVFGWLEKDLEYQSPTDCSRAGECSPLVQMGHVEAGFFLVVVLLVAIAVGVNMFRRTEA